MNQSSSDIFFIISSVGFVTLWILIAIAAVYFIRMQRVFTRIMEKIEDDIEEISDSTKDIFLDIRDNPLFRFFFKRRKRKHAKEIE